MKPFSSPELEEELDYLSENEILHRNEEDNIFTMIRRAKKFQETIQDLNFDLMVTSRLVKNNLENAKNAAQDGTLDEISSAIIYKYDNEALEKAAFEIRQQLILQKISENNPVFGSLSGKNVGRQLTRATSETMKSLEMGVNSPNGPKNLFVRIFITIRLLTSLFRPA